MRFTVITVEDGPYDIEADRFAALTEATDRPPALVFYRADGTTCAMIAPGQWTIVHAPDATPVTIDPDA